MLVPLLLSSSSMRPPDQGWALWRLSLVVYHCWEANLMTDPRPEVEALQRIERAEKAVDDLCHGWLRWEMRVPAEPDHDPDLIISAALAAARAAILARPAPPSEAEPADRAALAALYLNEDERDMLVTICDEGIEDWADYTAIGLRTKLLALSAPPPKPDRRECICGHIGSVHEGEPRTRLGSAIVGSGRCHGSTDAGQKCPCQTFTAAPLDAKLQECVDRAERASAEIATWPEWMQRAVRGAGRGDGRVEVS